MRFWLKPIVVLVLALCPAGAWAKSTTSSRKDGDPRRTVAGTHRADQPDATDAELMLDAVNKWRGESPDAAKIERISAEARAESKRKQVVVSTTWKDPFAEDPQRPIPVRQVVSSAKGLAAVRRELARARSETAAAQADAAAAHADAAKAKANMARTEAAAAWAQAVTAKHEASAARAACVDSGSRKHDVPAQEALARSEPDSFAPPKRHARATRLKSHGLASNARPGQVPSANLVSPVPTPPVEVEPDPPAAPLALTSAHSGILVVPITR
jgi:hypothetical protein